MTAYLDRDAFATLTTMPVEFVDDIEASTAGWVDAQLALWSAKIDSRLGKRYAVPFADPPPMAVKGWLAQIVTQRAYLRRGIDPTDPQMVTVAADAAEAWAEIKEAADAKDGLFDLPLRADTTATGISRGGTRSYTEASPYVGLQGQRTTGRSEDANGGGSYG